MKNTIAHFFKFKERNASFGKEVFGAFTTFSSIIYVMIINPTILKAAGMPFGSVMVATILTMFLSTFLMGLLANYPFAQAPGIGVSAFLAYSIVAEDLASWQSCYAALFITSLILILLSIFHVRRKILSSIPAVLLHAITCGIGLFLVCVGLKQIGILSAEHGKMISFTGELTAPCYFAFASLIILMVLEHFSLTFGFILVILVNWVLAVTLGYSEWIGIFQLPPSLEPTFFKLDFSSVLKPEFFTVFFSLFLVTLFDSTAGLHPLIKQGNLDKEKGYQKSFQRALFPDCISSFVGSLMGASIIATHIESISGMRAGAKTGLSSIIVALLFLTGLFLFPLFSTVPAFAIAPVLMTLGLYMAKNITYLSHKKDISEIVPFLITALIMPLTFSIYYGFAFGFISYSLMKLITGKAKTVPLSCWIFSALFVAQIFCTH